MIRKANINDCKVLNNLLTKLIRDEKKYDSNINENITINNFYESVILKEETCIFLAEENNKIIGYIYGFICNEGNTVNNLTSLLDAIYVEEDYRNKKIGDKLIREFKNWCDLKNVKYIKVNVYIKNEYAIKLYEKHGFKPKAYTMKLEM